MKRVSKVAIKSQAALEFLMTYGWAVLVVLVAVGALAYFGVLSPDKFIPRKCFLEAGIACMDFKVQEDSVTLVLRNGKGEDITISQLTAGNCTGTNLGILRNGEQRTFAVGGCTNTVSQKFRGEVNISYTAESGLSKKKVGSIIDRVESGCAICACANTDTSCGSYPVCANCNNLDSYGANYCSGSNVVRDRIDYSCSNQQCNPATIQELVQTCGANQICQSAQCVNAVAQFGASYSNLQKNSNGQPSGFPGSGYSWWYYNMQLKENGGIVGITVNQRQKCFNSAFWGYSCSPPANDVVTWFGANQIPAGGTINSITPNYFWIGNGDTVTVTETFWGIDSNNNNVQASYSFTVS